jgi:superfamily II DNA or RNA helicase
MAYINENETKNITENILKRKEFYKYKINDEKINQNMNIIPRFMVDKMIQSGNHLQLSSYQKFVSNYINPNTPYTRLMVKWETGVGKTIGSLSIAMNFIQYYRQETLQGNSTIGSVFVIGFTKLQFKNELIRFPEFGFITQAEIKKIKKLKKLVNMGNNFASEKLQELLTNIRKRFNNRENNGFFEFIGYKKLVNLIFIIKDSNLNISNLDEEGITKAIEEKQIVLNEDILNKFKNSIIICDEIHNTYNSLEKNNWGIAIQYILNYQPSARAVFLSATPINNNPTEVIDLLNLLLPHRHYPDKLKKSDFFDSNKKLKPGALEKIADLSKGRFSFLRDVNPKFFPSKKFIGENIIGAQYLKFVRCPMSPFHYNTYKNVYTGSLSPESQYLVDFAIPNPKDKNIGLYQTSKIKSELIYASQQWKDANKINFKKDKIVGEILQLKNLSYISTKYVEMLKTILKNIENVAGKMFIYHNVIHMSGVLFIQEILLQNHIIGEFDSSTANTICAVCGKLRKEHKKEQLGGAQNIIETNFSNKFTTNFNNYTQSYEVFLHDLEIPILEYKKYDNIIFLQASLINYNRDFKDISELVEKLSDNNIIIKSHSINTKIKELVDNLKFTILYQTDTEIFYSNLKEKMNSTEIHDLLNLIEIKGGKVKNKFNNADDHIFTAVRFITVHGMIDKTAMHNSIDKYNSPDNYDGGRIMILVGGKIIKEAYDIKAVREMMIMSRPENIPTLIQILGRSVRKNSHLSLDIDKRNVNIRIFTSCLPIKKNNSYLTSYEEDKYIEKIQQYKVIQEIEKTLHQNAIDAYINQDIIWSSEERRFYKKNKNYKELGPLYFEPNVSKKMNKTFTLNELNLETFNVFNLEEEISQIIIIIKRLFIEKSTIWNYKDLLYAVKHAGDYFSINFNTDLIDEELFSIGLSRLLWTQNDKYIEPFINDNNVDTVINKLFNINDKIIIIPDNQKSIISQTGQYYMLFPVDMVNNIPVKDLELPYRVSTTKKQQIINIKQFLESGHPLIEYSDKRDRFFNKWNNVAINNLEMAVCDFGTDFHILFLEECIEYIYNVWLSDKVKKSYLHSFYFKMINYYDLRGLIVWGHTLKPFMFKRYSKLLLPFTEKINKNKLIKENIKSTDLSSSGLINLLKSSINKSELNWLSSGAQKQFEDNVETSLHLFDGNYKKKSAKNKKVHANLIPVGHFLNYIPKFYHQDNGWIESPEYLDSDIQFEENSVIVGYDERSKTGVHIRFKIRNPIQNIKQFKDSRLIEKGSVCSSKNKIYLKEIAKKLDIKLKGKLNVETLCANIRTKLLFLEIKERVAKTKKKWFYFIYENRPETIM